MAQMACTFPLLEASAEFTPLSHKEMTAPGAIVPWCPSPVALVEDLVALAQLVSFLHDWASSGPVIAWQTESSILRAALVCLICEGVCTVLTCGFCEYSLCCQSERDVFVDIGCGDGELLLRAAAASGCSVHGYDISETLIRRASSRPLSTLRQKSPDTL